MVRRLRTTFETLAASPWTLRFTDGAEASFQQYYRLVFGPQHRATVVLAAVMVVAFGLNDFSFEPPLRGRLLLIRYAIAGPILVVLSVAHFVPAWRENAQVLGTTALLVGAGSLVAAFALSPPSLVERFSMGLMLMVLMAVGLARFQFRYILAATVILLPPAVVAIAGSRPEIGAPTVYIAYVAVTFVIGAFTSYSLELSVRQTYRAKKRAQLQTARLRRVNRTQELTILVRTRALQHETERLRLAVRERDTLYRELHHQVKNQMQVLSSLMRLVSDHTPPAQSDRYLSAMAHIFESLAPDAAQGEVEVSRILSVVGALAPAEVTVTGTGGRVPIRVGAVLGLLVVVIRDSFFAPGGVVSADYDSRAGSIRITGERRSRIAHTTLTDTLQRITGAEISHDDRKDSRTVTVRLGG